MTHQALPRSPYTHLCPICYAHNRRTPATVVTHRGIACCEYHADPVARYGVETVLATIHKPPPGRRP